MNLLRTPGRGRTLPLRSRPAARDARGVGMTYARRTMTAAAVSGALVLSGCGMVSGAGTSLRADSDHAKQALSSAKAVSVTIRFTDPDGNLKKALGTGHQPATPAQVPGPAPAVDHVSGCRRCLHR